MSDFELAFLQIQKLVESFKQNESKFLLPTYQEADVRNDYINKFFIALGWDVRHEHQLNPYEQEVKVEKQVEVAHKQKKADYAFFVSPNYKDVKFFTEAKKPFGNLVNKDDYFQTCRYGWNANTPIAILTDFNEFHILDCRFRPDINTILDSKLEKFHYSDYLDKNKFAKIYYLFSHEAVSNNSIEKYADALQKLKGKAVQKGLFKGGYQSIDESFLEELDEIRESLARAFKKSNSDLGSDELTEMTQRTIDRLVFIRFLEDKLIEPDHYVSEFGDSKNSWKDFLYTSRKLDAKYNGVVFKKHFIDSRNFIEPDDRTFSEICTELAHINSPYNFDIIPIHILGSIYERFLGKVVIATDKRVRIDDKPEVRKAGGVYYTPQYIVNYIVDNTIGKLIEGKTPKQIAKMRFADISCGSGSFLITVFDRLLDYHKKWYQRNSRQAEKEGCYNIDGKWVLSLNQKQKILTNNIYGVDIDHQAVEVTQLSLYLKLLEDETTATANDSWVMFKERLLPSLNKNIVCGNSLVGTDIFEGNLFEWEEEKNLKPMNFEDVFPKIMENGGFHAIVGNPPYGADFDKSVQKYLREKYSLQEYQLDSYLSFIEQALIKTATKGYIGYIIPNPWLTNIFQKKIRKFICENISINEIVHYHYKVFKEATVDTEIVIFNKRKPQNNKIRIRSVLKDNSEKVIIADQNDWIKLNGDPINITLKNEERKIIDKLKLESVPLKYYFTVTQGAKPYQVGKGKPKQTRKTVDEHPFDSTRKEDKTFKPLIRGSNVFKFEIVWNNDYWISFGDWLAEPRYSACYDAAEKIVIRQTGDSFIAALDDKQFIVRDNLYTIVRNKDCKIELKFLMAIINSKLMDFYYNSINPEKGEALAQVKATVLKGIPIKLIILESKSQKSLHDKLVHLVDQMLESKKQLNSACTDSEKEYLEKKCNTLDKQIDNFVYELYGLNEEEIEVIEKSYTA